MRTQHLRGRPRPTVVTLALVAAVLGTGTASAKSGPALPAVTTPVVTTPAVTTPAVTTPAVTTPTVTTPVGTIGTEPAPASGMPDPGSPYGLHGIRTVMGANSAFSSYKLTGKGVDVALIDTGVAPVPGLLSGNVVHGPDLSFDSQDPRLAHLDGHGHGTHMAGLIVGRDVVQTDPSRYADPARFVGVAPDARLISLKVGASDGAVDVTQVIAALHWVAEHGRKDGLNIRVVSLSYGTDSVQDYRVDPLAAAVEAVHAKGILVVVAGGNDGRDVRHLSMPAQHPRVLAVGGQDTEGTLSVRDDTVPEFANRGNGKRPVDLVAPAVSVHGLRVPGSWLDLHHPTARVGDRLFRGSGTSQAAAITAGAAALYLQRHPKATPDQVKAALQGGAVRFSAGAAATKGSGALNITGALSRTTVPKVKSDPATGTGSVEASRGSVHVVDERAGEPVVLEGEVDIFGGPLDADDVASRAAAGASWSQGVWVDRPLTGATWDFTTWRWATRTWTSPTWAGRSWTEGNDQVWNGTSWSGRSWSGTSWSGRSWSGRSWSGRSWSSDGWSTGGWQ